MARKFPYAPPSDIIKVLLENGAGVNVKDNMGKRPLFWAALGGDIKIVRLLREHGARK